MQSRATLIRALCFGLLLLAPVAALAAPVDVTPPTVTCSVTRTVLWPANGGLLSVGLAYAAVDDVDPDPLETLRVYSSEPEGALPFAPDVIYAPPSSLRLRAERAYPGPGRVYLVVVTAVDASGKRGVACCSSIVPALPTGANILALKATAAAGVAAVLASPTDVAPPGFVPVVNPTLLDRPTVAITRVNPTPTTAPTMSFDVVFSKDVQNVDPTDFVVATTGSASADALVAVGDGGDVDASTYVVTVTGVSPHGTVSLDLAPGTDIVAGATPVDQTPTQDEVYDVVEDTHAILSQPARSPGNVVATVSGLDLFLMGDAGDNGIVIASTASGDVVVCGVGGTTINGVAEFVAFSFVGGILPGRLTVDTAAGRDFITLADVTVTDQALVLCGNDVDAFNMLNSSMNDDFQVDEGGGSGFLDLEGGTFAGLTEIFAGEGDNQVRVRNAAMLGMLSLTAGTGNDLVALDTVGVFGATAISPGAGHDTVDLRATDHLGTLTITAAAGDDTVTGNDVDATAALVIDTGAGNDLVDFDDLHAMSTTDLILGADNDAARFLNSQFDGAATMPIVAGNNVIDLQGSTFNAPANVQATAGALALRIKNNTFAAAVNVLGGPGATDVLLDNATSSFALPPSVSGFEDLSNTHINALFANLLGLAFP